MEWNRLSMEWCSHEPGDGSRQEILVADADVASHGSVSLSEELRRGLQLRANLNEAVQLHTGTAALDAEALHQRLRKLGAQVVAHLSESWGQETGRQECQHASRLSAQKKWRALEIPCCSSMALIEPEWSLSYCWNSALHLCMKSHSAEKPNTSILPDRVLSNMSDEEDNVGKTFTRPGFQQCCSQFLSNTEQMGGVFFRASTPSITHGAVCWSLMLSIIVMTP